MVLTNEITVPQKQHMVIEYGSDAIKASYPDHTRVFHHTTENVCSLAYAITQKLHANCYINSSWWSSPDLSILPYAISATALGSDVLDIAGLQL